MSTTCIMPCLDIKDGRLVKGVHFVDLKDLGDPIEAALAYAADGARELVILDIAAKSEARDKTLAVIQGIVEQTSLTLTVGGGITSAEDARYVLEAGADRISVSSAAVRNPDLIDAVAAQFGSERIVVAIDVDHSQSTDSGYEVFIDGGRTRTGIDAIQWACDAERRGAGMILATSKATDGVKQGYDIPLLQRLKERVSIPVVASGGAGQPEHFLAAARAGADFLLAASVFHFGEIRISELTRYLTAQGIRMR